MKTCLFSACYLDGVDGGGSSRLERTIRYVEFYKRIKNLLGIQKIILADNASSLESIERLIDTVDPEAEILQILAYQESLKPGPNFSYPYCWRALYTIRDLILRFGYEKIISIDTDGFILNSTLAKYVRDCNFDWVAFWCPKYAFPESAFHILNKDAFPVFMDFTSINYMLHNGKIMEHTLPFQRVEKSFKTDRYGEDRLRQTIDMDYYGQCPTDIKLSFRMDREAKSESTHHLRQRQVLKFP